MTFGFWVGKSHLQKFPRQKQTKAINFVEKRQGFLYNVNRRKTNDRGKEFKKDIS